MRGRQLTFGDSDVLEGWTTPGPAAATSQVRTLRPSPGRAYGVFPHAKWVAAAGSGPVAPIAPCPSKPGDMPRRPAAYLWAPQERRRKMHVQALTPVALPTALASGSEPPADDPENLEPNPDQRGARRRC